MSPSQWRSRKAWWLGAAAIAYVLLTSLLTHLPLSPEVQGLAKRFDKLAHFGLYFVMVLLISAACGPHRRAALWGLIGTFTMVTLDEAWQALIPSRFVEFKDWLAGIAGTLAGWLVFLALVRWRRRQIEGQAASNSR